MDSPKMIGCFSPLDEPCGKRTGCLSSLLLSSSSLSCSTHLIRRRIGPLLNSETIANLQCNRYRQLRHLKSRASRRETYHRANYPRNRPDCVMWLEEHLIFHRRSILPRGNTPRNQMQLRRLK